MYGTDIAGCSFGVICYTRASAAGANSLPRRSNSDGLHHPRRHPPPSPPPYIYLDDQVRTLSDLRSGRDDALGALALELLGKVEGAAEGALLDGRGRGRAGSRGAREAEGGVQLLLL